METKRWMKIWVGVIAVGAFLALSASTTYATYESSLEGYWKFDETSAGPVVDATTNNNGTNNGATINQTGQFGRAYSFNGSTNYADIGNSNFSSGAWSFSYWFNVGAHNNYTFPHHAQLLLGNSRLIFGTTDYNGYNDYYFGWAGMGARMISSDIIASSWVHVAITYNGNGATNRANYAGYINGEEATLDTAAFDQTQTGNSLVGARHTDALGYFNYTPGFIDDMAIWSEELSDVEIAQIKNFGVESFEVMLNDLGFNTTEMAQLYTAYTNHTSTQIDGKTWDYYATDPGWVPGNLKIGDTWTNGSAYYIKLGSGQGYNGDPEGVPEPSSMAVSGLAIGLLGLIKKMRRRTK